MKKIKTLLIVLVILTSRTTVFANTSSNITDTLPEINVSVPQSKLRSLLLAAEQGRNAQEKITILNDQIKVLNDQIANLREIIDTYKSKEGDYKDEIQILNEQIKNRQDEIALMAARVTDLEKQLRKSKKGKKWLAFGGLASTVAAFIAGFMLAK